MSQKKDKKLQIMNGAVVKSKDHTTVVVVERLVKHPKYGKFIQHRTKYKAHDDAEKREVGGRVSIIACPPYSRDKRFRILRSETK
ncbi:MAG: 30S ribosomal protein S17 [Candidatus Taylorbacteria bacterium RIFCSPLOWO2_02_FULL_43_11]|uniref:30S ribosomal protein S17 n=1 Tax=Candidatus Taylorbacteria bacterium RIFCSPHIGHO2_02_FULL_43_32b TaxID=1802306 RepID=A0A1G2MJF6_9BACT|nr:MAG: 30S ribosomal protein S17 [Candidatus Taylorbacteria bacterium RIFCSPHIGHO2_01_FULL_43_47]OHA23299.1 MAG: 30S ribosomal protein S17 [Candidatus Taylorbacteria bacterium RIFCSPHIGHO2_02_FULL_43_32b]OHA30167.1 MAG: 30S ribosomal protein S17 [Candidatus Taylorbacteria bacterium RIFCSPLOWO2_01_FULL_43_44]OHA36024.1 MAG: 30S ribosomal protein S17 [Candidatus Taylorbacteria bacterium RIFCSPLOWO2_02_FULL_43_11]